MKERAARRSFCKRWQRWTYLRRLGGRCLLGLLTGCRSPATPYFADPGASCPARCTIVARQVVTDTAVEMVNHPLQSSFQVLAESAQDLRAASVGGIGKRWLAPLHGPASELPLGAESLDLAALEEQLQDLTGRELEPANVQLYVDGGDALHALEAMIDAATSTIDVIMFEWDNDEVGQGVARRLIAKAGPGCRVRILVDGGGNQFFGCPEDANAAQVNAALAALAQTPYVQVIRIRNGFARYDHRKVVIVDGRLVWTGGRNFSLDAFFHHHDLSFTLDGGLARQMQERFDRYWERQGGENAPRLLAELRPEVSLPGRSPGQPSVSSSPNTQARLLHSEPGSRELAPAVYAAVDQARQHVYVENVYLSDSLLIYKLLQARQRGVDVRVALTFTSDNDTVNRSNKVVANRLLRAGVRVYVNPGMTHVKALAVDGCWVYVGTGNFDTLSLRHNVEVGLGVSGCPLVRELEERLFQPDFCPAWELQQPLTLSLGDYLAELMAGLCL
jgi:cardiolipin synthase A/B